MKKITIIQAGSYRLALNSDHVLKVYPERSCSAEFLSDWQAFKKEQTDETVAIPLYSLPELLTGQPAEIEGARRLLILAEAATVVGLMVHAAEPEFEVAEDALQPLPSAFPEECRGLFAQVAVCGGNALPVLTVSTILAVARRRKGDNR